MSWPASAHRSGPSLPLLPFLPPSHFAAVHAAFAGYTGLTVGLVNTHYVYLPIPVVISAPRKASLYCYLIFSTLVPRCEVAGCAQYGLPAFLLARMPAVLGVECHCVPMYCLMSLLLAYCRMPLPLP